MRPSIFTDCEGNSRRDFIKLGTAGIAGLTLPNLLRLEAKAAAKTDGDTPKAKAKSVILVWLAGGPATIDMWDNKPEAPEGIRGEFKSISTKAGGMQVSECLPKMAAIGDKVTLVRSLAHTIPSHAPATVFMTTGNKPIPSLQYPSMGSLCTKLLPVERGIPAYVSFSELRSGAAGGAGFLGTGYNPFQVDAGGGNKGNMRVRGITLPNGFTQDDLERREKLLEKFDAGFEALDEASDLVDGLDSFHKQAIDILRSDKTKKAFNLATETDATRKLYGATPFGTSALAARRLVEAGVRFVTISTGGWDTHQQNFQNLKTKNLPLLDEVLAGLITDLDQRGLLDSTIVMCAGEFGRTPKINKNVGRDHWARSMACVLAGGGIKRGYVHGATDASGMAPSVDPVSPDDIASTLFHSLGIDPHLELQTPTGRPIQLFREGKVVEKLLA
jgi:hypothetical protein